MEKVTIEGWVARDRDGVLAFYSPKPERVGRVWCADVVKVLDNRLLPDLTWDNEPIPAQIEISKDE